MALETSIPLPRLLEVYQLALSLDFALQDSEAGESQLMPRGVIKKLCALLDADGGNFTMYHADEDYLEVRAWYSKEPSPMSFAEFRKKMKEIGTTNAYRIQSSSYKCYDRKKPILIERSSVSDVECMTLDVGSLGLRDNLSALAVPFEYHGQTMGVLNLDINDISRRQFNSEDLEFLQYLAILLPPILHNSLTHETITKISELILNKTDEGQEYSVLSAVCKCICDFLFVPWAGIYLRNESVPNYLGVRGHNGPQFGKAFAAEHRRIEVSALGRTTNLTLRHKSIGNDRSGPRHCEGRIGELFPFIEDNQLRAEPCRVYKLEDKSGFIDGLLILSDSQNNKNDSFMRICQFIADFTSLTLGALTQFEFRNRDAYEIAAHELQRNMRQLLNTQERLEGIYRGVEKDTKIDRTPDEFSLHQFRTIKDANRGHLATAASTLFNLVSTPRKDTALRELTSEYNTPVLIEAKKRNQIFKDIEKKPTIDLRYELNDICNSFTRPMNQKKVTWERERLGEIPKLIEFDRQNFHLVFENLVDNAVKYSKSGTSIRLTASVQELQIVLSIVNTGPPIDMRGPEKSDIFLARYRGLRAERMAADGVGLGLWQARLVARLWGGDPLKLAFCEPLPLNEGETDRWARVAFHLEIPIHNPNHILRHRGS